MEPAGGAAFDAADTRRTHWRGALIGVGVALAAGLLTLLAPQPAHASDDAPGLVGSLVHGVSSTAAEVVDPVIARLPDVDRVPVVGGLVGEVADSRPAGTVTRPVAELADGLLGDTVASLPLVGDILGEHPVGSITGRVGTLVDDALADAAGATDVAAATPGATPASAAVWLGSSLVASAGELLFDSRAGDLAAVVAVGAEGLIHGPVSVPGDLTPTSAVTAGGPPIGLAAAVLGAGLLFLLVRGRVGPAAFRAPPSPVFATDTSPD